MNRSPRGLLVFCVIIVLVSAIGVVYSRFASRKLFVELQKLRSEREAVDVQWGRLQLEQGALATNVRIEKIARAKLDMHIPAPRDVRVVSR